MDLFARPPSIISEEESTDHIILTPLEEAIEKDDVAAVRHLHDTGKLKDYHLASFASSAIAANKLEITRCLLELGVNPQDLALYTIHQCRSLDIYKLLKDFGFNWKLKGHNIIEYVIENRGILDYLLDEGVDLNQPRDRDLGYPGSVGFDNTCGSLNRAAALGDIGLLDYLVARGASISRSIALHTVAQCQDESKTVAMITHLIEKYKFDVNADDKCNGLIGQPEFNEFLEEGPPLNWALVWRNLPAVQTLIEYGASFNVEIPYIEQPLGVAIRIKREIEEHNPHKPMISAVAIKMFLDAGADAAQGLDCAVVRNNLEAAEIFLQHGADPFEAEENALDDISSEMQGLLDDWKLKLPVRG